MNAIPIRSLVYTALCSALFIVLSILQLKLAFSPIPITFQTLAVILVGILLKPRYAFLSVAIFIVLGLLGLPVFGGKSGLAHLFGPTGGFIMYFPFGAMLISMLTNVIEQKVSKSYVIKYSLYLLLFLSCSSWLSYLVGIPWFYVVMEGNMSIMKILGLACFPFLPGDVAKSIIGLLVLISLYKPIMRFRSQQEPGRSNQSTSVHTA